MGDCPCSGGSEPWRGHRLSRCVRSARRNGRHCSASASRAVNGWIACAGRRHCWRSARATASPRLRDGRGSAVRVRSRAWCCASTRRGWRRCVSALDGDASRSTTRLRVRRSWPRRSAALTASWTAPGRGRSVPSHARSAARPVPASARPRSGGCCMMPAVPSRRRAHGARLEPPSANGRAAPSP